MSCTRVLYRCTEEGLVVVLPYCIYTLRHEFFRMSRRELEHGGGAREVARKRRLRGSFGTAHCRQDSARKLNIVCARGDEEAREENSLYIIMSSKHEPASTRSI